MAHYNDDPPPPVAAARSEEGFFKNLNGKVGKPGTHEAVTCRGVVLPIRAACVTGFATFHLHA